MIELPSAAVSEGQTHTAVVLDCTMSQSVTPCVTSTSQPFLGGVVFKRF